MSCPNFVQGSRRWPGRKPRPVVDVPAQTGSGLVALAVLIATAGLVSLLRLRGAEPGL